MMKNLIKLGSIDFCNCGRKVNPVYLDIELNDTDKGPELSMMVVVYRPGMRSTEVVGQAFDTVKPYFADSMAFKEVYRLWQAYHLNGHHCGTPEQEACLADMQFPAGVRVSYQERCDFLKKRGLYIVETEGGRKRFEYGHGWIYKPIPPEDLAKIVKIIKTGLIEA